MNDIDKRLTRIEQATQLQASDDVILVQLGATWAAMTEAEKDKVRDAARRAGLPVIIMDR